LKRPDYIKKYLLGWGVPRLEDVVCEVCREMGWDTPATQVHHIHPRGMGGRGGTRDWFANLLGVCGTHHLLCDGHRLPDHKPIPKAEQEQLKMYPDGWRERLDGMLEQGE
jgi:hypothetical protein